MRTAFDVLSALVGAIAVLAVVDSVLRTFVLPRASLTPLSRGLFGTLFALFSAVARLRSGYHERDRVMALYAPVTLVAMPVFWLTLLWLAYTPLMAVCERDGFVAALRVSGSNLWTLGFERPDGTLTAVLAFSEAATGLLVVALLIAYVPTIYGTFSTREVMVSQLAIRSDTPPSATAMLRRAHAAGYLTELDPYFAEWERWFVVLQETHTSLAPLSYLRSPHPDRSWITAAGAVLDTAAFRMAVLDQPFSPAGGLCIRSGTLALRSVAELLGVAYPADPAPGDPIAVSRQEFDEVVAELQRLGVPLRADLDAAWRDFRGWRVNYDAPLIGLCGRLMAPYAPWSSDRSVSHRSGRAVRRKVRERG